MTGDFPALVGTIIHHCGALEFLTNNAIRALGTDDILSTKLINSPFSKRIDVLRHLLKARTKLQPSEIDNLCKDLQEIAEERNVIAHNPIVHGDPQLKGTPRILVVRHTPESAHIKKEITREDLVSLANRTKTLLETFVRLIPSSTQTK